jgi:hypothetical protein
MTVPINGKNRPLRQVEPPFFHSLSFAYGFAFLIWVLFVWVGLG